MPLFVLLVLAQPVWAQDDGVEETPTSQPAAKKKQKNVTTTFSDDFDYRYWRSTRRLPDFPDRAVFNYVEQVNRFTGLVASGKWQAFVQVDEVSLWANNYRLDGELLKERDLVDRDQVFSPLPGDAYANIEKVFISRETKSATLVLGDFYGAFGSGIALNLNRNVDIDIDTSIQGAKALIRRGPVDLTLLGGQLNRQQVFQENPNLNVRGDYRHLIAGVEAKWYGPATLGAHAVGYRFATEPGPLGALEQPRTAFDTVITGATVEGSLLGIDWMGEGDAFVYPSNDDGGNLLFEGEPGPLGYAGYLSGTTYVGDTIWQLEGKRYLQVERPNSLLAPELYETVIGPTLEYERAITEDSSAAVNSNDLWGGRLRVDWAANPPAFTPYVSVAVFRDLETGGLHFNDTPETIVHTMVGVEARPENFSVVWNAGLRYDDRDGKGDTEVDADRHWHSDIDVKFPLPAGIHADFTVYAEYYQWGVNPLQQEDYVEIETSATFALPGEKIFLVWYTDMTTNPLVDSVGNLGSSEALYGAGEVQFKPSDAITLKAFVGAYKAGIRCSGGQCRLLPGFDGARASVTANF